jgi:hypothetical protein
MDEIPPEEAEELEVMAELQELMGPGTEASTIIKSGQNCYCRIIKITGFP